MQSKGGEGFWSTTMYFTFSIIIMISVIISICNRYINISWNTFQSIQMASVAA